MSTRLRRLSKTLFAAAFALIAIVALPGVSEASVLALTTDVPNNTFSPWQWSFTATQSRWGIVFVHPYNDGDEDLSVSSSGVRLSQTGSTQVSEQPENRMDFVALDFHHLPLGTYTANTWAYRGQPAYQIIYRQSSGTVTPHSFGSGTRFVTPTSSARGALLGAIFELTTDIGQDYIITAEVPGSVMLVEDYWTSPLPTQLPLRTVRIPAIPRSLSLYKLRDDETCMRVSGDGALHGLVVLFRDHLGDEVLPKQHFNVEYATPAQAESRGCRWANNGF